MEEKPLDDLKADPMNPRLMRRHEADNLGLSMTEFGDLSPIIMNNQTGQMVGGHQRTRKLRELMSSARIKVTQRFNEPKIDGTVALGYVDYGGRLFAYREVDWSAEKQRVANIAANRTQGEFDLDKLAQVNFEISQMENAADAFKLSGQTEDEVNKLLNASGSGPDDDDEVQDEPGKMEFYLTDEQREIVDEAIGHVKSKQDVMTEQNSSINGNALYYICRDYLDRLHGLIQNETPTAPTPQPPIVAGQ